MSRRLPVVHSRTVVGHNMDGRWVWTCEDCGATSKYGYSNRQRSEQLARRHAVTCKAVQP